MSVFISYLHNHEADLLEHEDCIAYVLALVFSVALICIVVWIAISQPRFLQFSFAPRALVSIYLFIRPTRAPPVFSFEKIVSIHV